MSDTEGGGGFGLVVKQHGTANDQMTLRKLCTELNTVEPNIHHNEAVICITFFYHTNSVVPTQ